MFGSSLPSLWSSTNQSLLGVRSRRCYAIKWVLERRCPIIRLTRSWASVRIWVRGVSRPSTIRFGLQQRVLTLPRLEIAAVFVKPRGIGRHFEFHPDDLFPVHF